MNIYLHLGYIWGKYRYIFQHHAVSGINIKFSGLFPKPHFCMQKFDTGQVHPLLHDLHLFWDRHLRRWISTELRNRSTISNSPFFSSSQANLKRLYISSSAVVVYSLSTQQAFAAMIKAPRGTVPFPQPIVVHLQSRLTCSFIFCQKNLHLLLGTIVAFVQAPLSPTKTQSTIITIPPLVPGKV